MQGENFGKKALAAFCFAVPGIQKSCNKKFLNLSMELTLNTEQLEQITDGDQNYNKKPD